MLMRKSFNGCSKSGVPPLSPGSSLEHEISVINQYRVRSVRRVFNAGGVNVKTFPSTGASNTSFTGLPVDRIYPTYTMMPFQSDCRANSVDDC